MARKRTYVLKIVKIPNHDVAVLGASEQDVSDAA
eukprot:CAMPEP_0169163958 /NCGR_PEP_ID=MMETSP1015-20121227/58562_1 /TAXON_ID=342587 /ORGANISM="Karlodinium micrum, Strain CCMP2283" /LENGTH=33 /DNA_ID= /DNA_START= /DNA_END= /DNA_ORIENTATION=